MTPSEPFARPTKPCTSSSTLPRCELAPHCNFLLLLSCHHDVWWVLQVLTLEQPSDVLEHALMSLICCRLRHTSRLDPGAGLELDCTDLGACAQEIVLATLQATATLQDSLLFPGALSPGTTDHIHMYLPTCHDFLWPKCCMFQLLVM